MIQRRASALPSTRSRADTLRLHLHAVVAVFRALYSSAQLFPADIQHAPTRKILQSVTRWADRIASSPLCTTRDHAVVDKVSRFELLAPLRRR